MAEFWSLTIARFATRCLRCGWRIRPGFELVWKSDTRESYCRACADRLELEHETSWLYEHRDQ